VLHDKAAAINVNSIWMRCLPPFVRKRLEGRHYLQKIIRNISWLFADKIVRMGIGLLVGVWIARYLGPDQFGLFSYSAAFVTLFSIFATLGLDGIVIRDLLHNPEQKNEILGTAFLIKLVGGGVTLLLAVTTILLLRPSDSLAHSLVAIVAAGTIFQSFDVIDFWFQSRVESRWAIYARNAAFVVVSTIRILLILNHATLIAFAWAASLETVLGAVGLIIAYRANGQHVLSWNSGVSHLIKLMSDSWPLALAGMAVAVYVRIDQIMLGQMVGNNAVGTYSAATRISEVWYFIPISIVASVSPSLIEAKKVSIELYYQRLLKLFRLMVVLALSIAVPMTFLAGYVATVLYGNEYEGVGTILAIHIWASLFVFLGVAQGPWNINEGLTQLTLLRTFVGAVANVILNLLLIPKDGAVGAAIATTVSYALAGVFLNAFSSKTRKIFLLQIHSIFTIGSKKS
jgi:O-antigen/teichoic acid export membrane protein